MCYCEKADNELIIRAIDKFDWLRVLSNMNVDETVSYLTKTLLDIIHNFHNLYEAIVCDDRYSPWRKLKKNLVEKITNLFVILAETCFFSKSSNSCTIN